MLRLRGDDPEALTELQRLHDEQSAERSGNVSWSSSSSSLPPWPPGPGGSSSGGATASAGKSTPHPKPGADLPFDLHAVDVTRLKIDTMKRTWISPDTGEDETFAYPIWDSHDIRFA